MKKVIYNNEEIELNEELDEEEQEFDFLDNDYLENTIKLNLNNEVVNE